VPPEVKAVVKSILDETVLDATTRFAAACANVEQFATELRAIPRLPEPLDPADEPEPEG
jgi:hypothetical protein